MKLLPSTVWTRFLKRRLPTSLWGRSLLIIVLPVLLMQVFVTWAFFDAHWQTVNARLSDGLAGDIAWAVETYAEDPTPETLETLAGRAERTLSLSIAVVGVMLFYGFEFWHFAWERGWKSDTVWGVRLWIPYMALPVGFGLFLLQLVADLIALLLNIDKPFGLHDDVTLTERADLDPVTEEAMDDPANRARAAQDFSEPKGNR